MARERVIDAAAQAARRAWLGGDACRRMPWDEVAEGNRERWREVARAVAETLDQGFATHGMRRDAAVSMLDREVSK